MFQVIQIMAMKTVDTCYRHLGGRTEGVATNILLFVKGIVSNYQFLQNWDFRNQANSPNLIHVINVTVMTYYL